MLRAREILAQTIQMNQRRTVFSARPSAGAAAPASVSRAIAIALQPSARRADVNARAPVASRKKADRNQLVSDGLVSTGAAEIIET